MAVEFSLNTHMFLLSKRSLWLSDGSMGFGQESDVAFSEGAPPSTLKNCRFIIRAVKVLKAAIVVRYSYYTGELGYLTLIQILI